MSVRLATAAALLLIAPATARATPVLDPLKPCYDAAARDSTESVRVAGTGFTPNVPVDIELSTGRVWPGLMTDATGALPGWRLPAPYVAGGSKAFTVKVTEQANPAQTVSATARVTRLTVAVRPRASAPTRKVRFTGSGFTADAPVYAHYVRRGKVRRTVRLVKRPAGTCGRVDVRRRQFPFLPRAGRWTIRVDQDRRYRTTARTPSVRLRVDVRNG